MIRSALVLEPDPFARQLRTDLVQHHPPLERADLVFLRLLENLMGIPEFWRSKNTDRLIEIEARLINSMINQAGKTLAWMGLPSVAALDRPDAVQEILVSFQGWLTGPLAEASVRPDPARAASARLQRLGELYAFLFSKVVQHDRSGDTRSISRAIRRGTGRPPRQDEVEEVRREIIVQALEQTSTPAYTVTSKGIHRIDADRVRDIVANMYQVKKVTKVVKNEDGTEKKVRRRTRLERFECDLSETEGAAYRGQLVVGKDADYESLLLMRALRRFRRKHRGDPAALAAARYLEGQTAIAISISLADAAAEHGTTVGKVRKWTDSPAERRKGESRIIREIQKLAV